MFEWQICQTFTRFAPDEGDGKMLVVKQGLLKLTTAAATRAETHHSCWEAVLPATNRHPVVNDDRAVFGSRNYRNAARLAP